MDDRRMVMIPGPTPVIRPIQDEMGREVQAFGDPRFVADYRALINGLGKLFNCGGRTFPLAGTGTAAMEMALSNTTKRGDDVLIISHGFFGDRFIEIAGRKGLSADVMAAEWGTTIPLEDIERKLSEKRYAAVTVTHVDTATGVRAPIEAIGELLKRYPDTIYIVDGVAATGGEYADVDNMNIDVMFTASQKAFGVCPGMFIVWAGEKALARRRSLGTIPEYYLDFEKWLPIMEDPSKYFATPPINLVWALLKSMRIMEEEGLMPRYERHLNNARAMQAAFEQMGFTVLAKPHCRAVTLSNLIYPEGVVDADYRATLLDEGMIVAGGLGPYAGRMMRIGHMGNVDTNDMVAVLGMMERALIRSGHPIEPGCGIRAYTNALLSFGDAK